MSAHDTPEWFDAGWPHVWLPYAQMQTTPAPLPVVAADGVRLTLADGRTLIDGVASWWTVCHGYNHPHMVSALKAQAETLAHVMFGGLAHASAYTLASRLAKATPEGLNRVFFSDSGSIAVEVALKMALQYWRNKGEPKRNKFICFSGAYHGDTFGAMAVSDRSEFGNGFDSALTRNYVFDIPRDEYAMSEFSDTVAAIRGSVAGILIEPLVQCAGGMRLHNADVLSEIRRVAREQNILFIADEIATGFMRTGSMFACNEAAVTPDIMCVGKALTGGVLPLAATLATEAVYEAFLGDEPEKALMHGPTYMANAMACAAANASLDIFTKEPRQAQVERIEQQLWDELKSLEDVAGVKDVRVKGAIGVVEIDGDARVLREAFIRRGTWIRPFGNVVYVMPPLCIGEADLGMLTSAVVTELG